MFKSRKKATGSAYCTLPVIFNSQKAKHKLTFTVTSNTSQIVEYGFDTI